jgi:hypothetical protein
MKDDSQSAPSATDGIREKLSAISEHAAHRGETESSSSTNANVRRLTSAVWALTLVIGLHMVSSMVIYLSSVNRTINFSQLPSLPPSAFSSERSDVSSPTFPPNNRDYQRFNGFHDWPLQKQIDSASVIVIAKYEKDGDRYKAMISEILKKDTNTTFYYKVGDEYDKGGYYPKEGTRRGEGQIIFFTDSPAMMRYACSFYGDRIAGLGDMPLEELRKLISKK